jgi:hypothetical protein
VNGSSYLIREPPLASRVMRPPFARMELLRADKARAGLDNLVRLNRAGLYARSNVKSPDQIISIRSATRSFDAADCCALGGSSHAVTVPHTPRFMSKKSIHTLRITPQQSMLSMKTESSHRTHLEQSEDMMGEGRRRARVPEHHVKPPLGQVAPFLHTERPLHSSCLCHIGQTCATEPCWGGRDKGLNRLEGGLSPPSHLTGSKALEV